MKINKAERNLSKGISLVEDMLGTKFVNIEYEYLYDEECDEYNHILLKALNNLSDSDRKMLILYAELKSMDKMAKLFKCSKKLIFTNINRIREIFKDELNKINKYGYN